jgi:hypothetical protein
MHRSGERRNDRRGEHCQDGNSLSAPALGGVPTPPADPAHGPSEGRGRRPFLELGEEHHIPEGVYGGEDEQGDAGADRSAPIGPPR